MVAPLGLFSPITDRKHGTVKSGGHNPSFLGQGLRAGGVGINGPAGVVGDDIGQGASPTFFDAELHIVLCPGITAYAKL